MKILVCALNGAGKSTFGRALAERLGYAFKDIEDYYFPGGSKDYKYQNARSHEEVGRLLLADLLRYETIVLASVKCEYGHEVEAQFTHAVYLDVPCKIRQERVRERSYRKYGGRMLEGGDLYESEERFFKLIDGRSEDYVKNWLVQQNYRTITIDGTKSIEENVDAVIAAFCENG